MSSVRLIIDHFKWKYEKQARVSDFSSDDFGFYASCLLVTHVQRVFIDFSILRFFFICFIFRFSTVKFWFEVFKYTFFFSDTTLLYVFGCISSSIRHGLIWVLDAIIGAFDKASGVCVCMCFSSSRCVHTCKTQSQNVCFSFHLWI